LLVAPVSVALRRAGAADAEAIAELWLRSWDAALPTVRRAHDDAEVRAFTREVLVPLRETWVAGLDPTVAFMVLHDGWVEQLYLDPPWRGQGIGAALVALAKRRNPTGLQLWTFQVNGPARRFYERLGFVAVELTDGSVNDEREPDVRYAWTPGSPGIV
jgi:GNAT superfamily N-acetyltransferase